MSTFGRTPLGVTLLHPTRDDPVRPHHQENGFSIYLGHQPPDIGRAARLFWLELVEPTVEANLQGSDPSTLTGRLLNRDVNEISCQVDVFGVGKTLDRGAVQHLLEPDFALRLADSSSIEDFERNVRAVLTAA